MDQLDKCFSSKLEGLRSLNLLRKIRNYNQSLIDFASNDYLRLKDNQRIKTASIKAIEKHGVGGASSRLITGNSKLYDDLEQEIAGYYYKKSACVFSSGYAANIGAIPTLVGKDDLIILDRLCHSCIVEGAKLSGAKIAVFKHNNYQDLEKILAKQRNKYSNCLIVSEAVFSMDGDRCNLKALKKIAEKYHCWSYVDFAHDILTADEENMPDIVMGTFSKAFASLGGYVCGNQAVIEYIKNKAKSLVYSTALPPSALATSLQAIKEKKSNPNLVLKALENAKLFCDLMNLAEPESQIVPIIIGDEGKALKIQKEIEEKGFIISCIRPPTVPKGTARLRVSFSSKHEESDIKNLVLILKKILAEQS